MTTSQEPLGGLTPYIMVGGEGAAAAADFYAKAFGAIEVHRHAAEDGKRLMHCHLHINGSSLMMSDAFPEYGYSAQEPAAVTLHLQVPDAEAAWDQAVAAGCTVTMPLADQFWGDRYGQVKDPFGFTWSIGGPIKA